MNWNKVKISLPAKDGAYFLVHRGNIEDVLVGYFNEDSGFSDELFSYDTGEITHWMEIPKL